MNLNYCIILLIVTIAIHSKAQKSTFAINYHKALITKSIDPISEHFLNSRQFIKLSSWPNSAEVINGVDSMLNIYKDSITQCLHLLDKKLTSKGFLLTKSVLENSERTLGVFGQVKLTVSYNGKKAFIYTDVMDVNGKDYLISSFPSDTPSKERINSAFIRINNENYPLWNLRKTELEQAEAVLAEASPIKYKGKEFTDFTHLVFSQGIINKDGSKCFYLNASRKGDSTQLIIFIDLEKETIVKVDQKIPELTINPLRSLSKKETYNQIKEKRGENTANEYLRFRSKKDSFYLFLDSLRNTLVEQSGGYHEVDGRKFPKGKKDKETPHKIFIIEGKGKELKRKILELEKVGLSLIKNVIDRDSIHKELPTKINEEMDKERGITWEEYVFDQMPVAAIFPMLRKFKNDAKSTENVIVNYLINK